MLQNESQFPKFPEKHSDHIYELRVKNIPETIAIYLIEFQLV